MWLHSHQTSECGEDSDFSDIACGMANGDMVGYGGMGDSNNTRSCMYANRSRFTDTVVILGRTPPQA